MNKQLMSPTEVAENYSGFTIDWLARRRWDRLPPIYSKLGHKILYKRADIDQLVADATVGSV
ncbi:hypothetical protein MCEMIH16_02011 [Caulobacteraceae bacterium]